MWGLPAEAIRGLGERLHDFHQRYADCFETTTRDASHFALAYLSGLLRMTTERNFTNVGRASGEAPQNVQHFMTNSPWSAAKVLQQVRAEIAAIPAFAHGGALLLDESADKQASDQSVGAGRQHNGRLGKVEMSQVGTFLAYLNDGLWTWVDGELFLPAAWFAPAAAAKCARLGVPPERSFRTKIELGWQMIERVQAQGLPFELVACDTLYGRNQWLRRTLDGAGLTYCADVPADTRVYLTCPEVRVPPPKTVGRGRRPTRLRVVSRESPVEARALAAQPETVWTRVLVRVTERGQLNDEFSARRVWTVEAEQIPRAEWLILRREGSGQVHYALSNASAETRLERLAWSKCQRHFIEVCNREAKSELGWDELRAQKYPAWEHHLALTILASWFMAQTKLDWRRQYPRTDDLPKRLGVKTLPALSVANVRQLLRAVMPLPQLTVESATELVIEHLINRTRARKSRMKSLAHSRSPD